MSSTFLGMPATPPRSPYGTGNLRGDRKFPEAAHDELRNEQLRRNLGRATRTIRAKRLDVTGELPDWEALREAGSAIKTDTMNRLPELLEQLERKVTERGGTVHWARDGVEANEIVARLVRATGSSDVIKVKSMATQEIGLNEHLESVGITPYETDLAELIVQLAHDKPSHILVPAIHRNRDEIRQIFLKEIPGVDEPGQRHGASRRRRPRLPAREVHDDQGGGLRGELRHRRDRNPRRRGVRGQRPHVSDDARHPDHRHGHREGAAALSGPRSVPAVAAALLHRRADEPVHLDVDRGDAGRRTAGVPSGPARQRPHRGARRPDRTRGPQLHSLLGLSQRLPGVRTGGGHAYGSTYPGPIGAVLTPQLAGMHAAKDDPNSSLPYASSLCGACFDACPVKIDIPSLLVELRHQHTEQSGTTAEKLAMKAAATVMKHPKLFTAAQKGAGIGRVLGGRDGKISHLPPPFDGWSESRDTEVPPKQTFRSWLASAEGAATMRAAADEYEQNRRKPEEEK